MGINWNFAPVADVNVNPANPVIGVRSFSENPGLAASLTAAQTRGYTSAGIAGAAKHFPGHGDTATDSHTGLPVIDHTREEWEQMDRPPFQAAIDAGVPAIMTAHISVPALDPSGDPATLSKPIMTGILRNEMGYDGVVITDALDMAGASATYGNDRVPVLALKAGVDMLLMPPEFDVAYNAVLDAVESGELTEERIDTSVRRILTLKHDLGIVDDPLRRPGRGARPRRHPATTSPPCRRSPTARPRWCATRARPLPLDPGTGAGRAGHRLGREHDRRPSPRRWPTRGATTTSSRPALNPTKATDRRRRRRRPRTSDLVVVLTNRAGLSTPAGPGRAGAAAGRDAARRSWRSASATPTTSTTSRR